MRPCKNRAECLGVNKRLNSCYYTKENETVNVQALPHMVYVKLTSPLGSVSRGRPPMSDWYFEGFEMVDLST